jgi:hypothetical protein
MQRTGIHKVLGRGCAGVIQVNRARVLMYQRAGADVGR